MQNWCIYTHTHTHTYTHTHTHTNWYCPTLCDRMDCSPLGSSVHGILQSRILEWVAISFSRGSSQQRDQTHVSYVSCIIRWVLYLQNNLESPSMDNFFLSKSISEIFVFNLFIVSIMCGQGNNNSLQYSWASLVAQLVKKPPAMRETWL